MGIQGRLSEIDAQLRTLKAESAGKIGSGKSNCAPPLPRSWRPSGQSWPAAGASTVSIDRQMKSLEEKKNRELDAALASFRRQADVDLAKREAEINVLFAQYQQSLEDARTEKTRLEKEMISQRAELLEKAQGDTAQLTEALGSLREQTRREQLVADQIANSYRAVESSVRAGRWDEAVSSLDALSTYLDAPAVSSLPAVQKRKPVELFLVDSLKDLITSRRGGAAASSTAAAGPGAPAASAEAAELVDRAEASYRAGDLVAARQSYAAAVRTVPELKTVPDRLAAIEDANWAGMRKSVTEAVTSGDAAYAGGNYKAALDRYANAFEALRGISTALPRAGVRVADSGWRQGFADLVAREDRSAKPLVDRADGFAKAGRWSEAFSTYASVLRTYPQSTLGPQAVAGVERSVDGLLKARDAQVAQRERDLALAQKQADDRAKAAADEKLRVLSEGLSASLRRAGSSAATAQKELIELLEAKVKMKEVLGSASVEAQYRPGRQAGQVPRAVRRGEAGRGARLHAPRRRVRGRLPRCEEGEGGGAAPAGPLRD